MSLKFGIYLVEQRIISPEQFCGLVKVQQEAMMSIATIAIRKNLLTINQVARVMDLQDANSHKTFLQLAVENDMMEEADASHLVREQELTCPKIRSLVVECGLLTERQSSVLFHHFERQTSRSTTTNAKPTSQPVQQRSDQVQPATVRVAPPQPKFQQRPLIVNAFSEATIE